MSTFESILKICTQEGAKIKINKEFYNSLLTYCIDEEKYEEAAKLKKYKDELINVDKIKIYNPKHKKWRR